jgi:hypothetical protein
VTTTADWRAAVPGCCDHNGGLARCRIALL